MQRFECTPQTHIAVYRQYKVAAVCELHSSRTMSCTQRLIRLQYCILQLWHVNNHHCYICMVTGLEADLESILRPGRYVECLSNKWSQVPCLFISVKTFVVQVHIVMQTSSWKYDRSTGKTVFCHVFECTLECKCTWNVASIRSLSTILVNII